MQLKPNSCANKKIILLTCDVISEHFVTLKRMYKEDLCMLKGDFTISMCHYPKILFNKFYVSCSMGSL